MLADSAGGSSSSVTTVSVTPSLDVRRIDLTVAGVLACFDFLFYVDVFVVLRHGYKRLKPAVAGCQLSHLQSAGVLQIVP